MPFTVPLLMTYRHEIRLHLHHRLRTHHPWRSVGSEDIDDFICMKLKHAIIAVGVVAIAAGAYSAAHTPVAPDFAYPDTVYTPGLAATQSIDDLTASYDSQTYSQAHRNVPQSVKNAVCKEYPQNCTGPVEIDHFIPVALGGSNDITNLWAEPGTGQWNFHDKDKLEAFLVIQVKTKRISVKDAQNCIVSDWVACYQRYIKPSYGGVNSATDLDDEMVQ